MHPLIAKPDPILLTQWGARESAFFTSSLQECRGKCAADPGCSAVTYTDAASNMYPYPNCLPTMGDLPGTFRAHGCAAAA